MKAKSIVRKLVFTATILSAMPSPAAPPETLLMGGRALVAADGRSPSGATWCLYRASDSSSRVSGPTVQTNTWFADVGGMAGMTSIGADFLLVASCELGAGTLGHTGYYAVINHFITGRDPEEFNTVTLRQIPRPVVTADSWAYLNWSNALADSGEGGATNIAGYNVYRSTNGISFTKITPSKITQASYIDLIPNDTEYYYALGLVYRGTPVVTSSILSANSARVFKDSDADGLPDYFEIANGLDPESDLGTNGPAGDADNDTMSNFEECIAGTAANDHSSRFFAKQVDTTGDLVIRWDGVAGRSYRVSKVLNLTNSTWQVLCDPLPCTADGPMQYTDSTASTNELSFYRIAVRKR